MTRTGLASEPRSQYRADGAVVDRRGPGRPGGLRPHPGVDGGAGAAARGYRPRAPGGERHVIVEEGEEPLQEFLRDWGFEPIPCRFRTSSR